MSKYHKNTQTNHLLDRFGKRTVCGIRVDTYTAAYPMERFLEYKAKGDGWYCKKCAAKIPSAESGVIVGHSDINGRAGEKAQMPDGKIWRVGGGEIILNEKTSTKHCKQLSKWSQEDGGVSFDCNEQKVANTDRASGKMPKGEYHKEHSASLGENIAHLSSKESIQFIKDHPVAAGGNQANMTKEEIAADKTLTKKARMIALYRLGVSRKEIMSLAKANAGEVSNAIKAANLQTTIAPTEAPKTVDVAAAKPASLKYTTSAPLLEKYGNHPYLLVKKIDGYQETHGDEFRDPYTVTFLLDGDKYEFKTKGNGEYDNSRKDEDNRPYSWFEYSLLVNGKLVDSGKYSDGGYEEPIEHAGYKLYDYLKKKNAATPPPVPTSPEYDRFLRALKSSQKMTTKELMAEFGIRDEQQMYGTAKRGDVFDKQYMQLSDSQRLGNKLRVLRVLTKMWPATTTVSQKMVSSEQQHRYENGEDTESEYGVSKSSEVEIGIFDKKTGTKIGDLKGRGFHFEIDALNKIEGRLFQYFNAQEKNPDYVVYEKEAQILTESEVPFSEIMTKYHAAIANKKIADAWKKEKVPAEKKQEARRKFSEWQRNAMSTIKQRLKDRGFKKGHPAYYNAEQALDVLRDYVTNLIQYPVFYVYEMGYEFETSFYQDTASVNFQITASTWEIKNKNPDHKYGWRDVRSTAASILAEEINPILGTKYSSSGYSYGNNRVGFGVYAKNAAGGFAASGTAPQRSRQYLILKMRSDMATTESDISKLENDIKDQLRAKSITDDDASNLHYLIKLRRHSLFGTKIFAGGNKTIKK